MLLQTNSYVVSKEKRTEHARLLNRFRQTLARLGCDQFEVYEQTGANWSSTETTGRFVQIMRFRDRKHQLAVQAAERTDPQAQALIKEFCELIDFPSQQQQGLFAVGFYSSVLPVTAGRTQSAEPGGPHVEPPAPADAPPPLESAGELAHEGELPLDERRDTVDGGSRLDDLESVKPEDNGQPILDPQEQNPLI